MMLSMVPFVVAIVIPALVFYLYAIGRFLREALRMRNDRLARRQIVVPFPGTADTTAPEMRSSNAVVPFLPNPGGSGHRGVA